jgi:signal transduction histidine kinase
MKWVLLITLLLALGISTAFTFSVAGSGKSVSGLDTLAVNKLCDRGYQYWLEGNDSLAILYSNQALSAARKAGFLPGEIKARLHLTRIELDRFMDVKPAYAQLDTLLQIARKTSDKRLQAKVMMRRAQFYEQVFEFQSQVMPLLNEAEKLYVSVGDKLGQALVLGEKSQVLGGKGNFADAVNLLLKARNIQEQAADTASLRSTLPNLAVNYIAMGLYDQATEVLDLAEVIAQKRKDNILIQFLYMQRAQVFEKKGKYRLALNELAKAVKIQGESAPPYRLARTYARMGQNYLMLKDYRNGLKYTVMADKAFAGISDSEQVLDHYVQSNYGRIYLANRQYRKVINYAEKGLEWAMGAEPVLLLEAAEYNRQLAEAYEGLGNAGKALQHLKQYKSQSDTLLNQESVQRITAAAMSYEFDKKQQVSRLKIEALENNRLTQSRNILIGLVVVGFLITAFILWSNRKLKNKNHELIQKNEQIQQALFKGQKIERKRVASELHDNLNTKLAALRWRMEAVDMESFEPGDRKIHDGSLQMLDDIYQDVRLISHSMLPVELETKGLLPALRKLVEKLNVNEKTQFYLETDGMEERFAPDTEHQLYIIALELVNNVIKHAQASEVWISLLGSAGRVSLAVSDNGIGMSEEGKGQGMGLGNLASRVDALGGKLGIDTEIGKGTKTTIDVNL